MYPGLLKKWYWIAAATGMVLMVVWGSWLLLPYYLQNHLLPRLVVTAGLDPQDVRIRRLGLNGADLGPVRLNLGDNQFLSIPSLQISYSPLTLLSRKIDSIVFSGLRMDMQLNDNATAILGLTDRAPSSDADGASFSFEDLEERFPVAVSRFAMHNCVLGIHWRGHLVDIPMDLSLDFGGPAAGSINGDLRFRLRGSAFDVSCAINAEANSLDLKISADQIPLERFSDLFGELKIPSVHTKIRVNAKARFSIQPFSLTALNSAIGLSATRFPVQKLSFKPVTINGDHSKSVTIQVDSPDGKNWTWTASPLILETPVQCRVTQAAGSFVLQDDQWVASADVNTLLDQLPDIKDKSLPVYLSRPFSVGWRLSAQSGPIDDAVQFSVVSQMDDKTENISIQGTDNGLVLESLVPQVRVSGHVGDVLLSAHYEIAAQGINLHSHDVQVGCPEVIISGSLTTGPGPDTQIETKASASPVKIRGDNGFSANLPHNTFFAHIANKKELDWTVQGVLEITDGQMRLADQAVAMDQLTVHMPVQWPFTADAPQGTIRFDDISWHRKKIGSVKGRLGFGADHFWTRLQGTSKLFPGLSVHIDSEASASGVKAHLSIPAYRPGGTLDLSDIWPEAAGYTVSGQLSVQAEYESRGKHQTSSAHIAVDEGELRHAKSQTAVEGITLNLSMKDLIAMQSAAQQHLKVESITMGKLNARALDVQFQIEPEATLFIEKATLQWCRGGVQVHALRLTPDLNHVETTLFCDRLNLAMLLEQLSLAQGSGDGAVNGRIPVQIYDGHLRFENGFLFSTPGQSGSIRLSGTEILLEGFPPGTPQHLQLDIATEALKDYSYNWAKLRLESQGNLLVASLQLDGKPNRPLPFGYDPQTGSLKRIKGQGEADFKGIAIDLNFKTPLDDILHYKGLLSNP